MTFIDSWDMGGPVGWDSGLQWDVNVGLSPGDTQPYLDLVTSEHKVRPKFISTLIMLLKPYTDCLVLLKQIPSLYDLDLAVGAQLDVVGQWVGATRNLKIPINNVYFAFDDSRLGFDQGTWLGPEDDPTGVFTLADDAYRTLLRARIANNQWDGTVPGAYAIWDLLFAGTGTGILIQDSGNMHMIFALTGTPPDAVTNGLMLGGYLALRPAGVMVDGYMTPTVDGPYFGFDVTTPAVAGFDAGAWGRMI